MKKIFLLGVLVLLSFTGCNEEKSMQKEITVYTAIESDLISNYIKAFNNEYPEIKVNVISGGTGDMIAKLIAEQQNPQADVIWSTSDIQILDDYNLLKGYNPQKLERVPLIFRDVENKEAHWVGVSAWMIALEENTIEYEKTGLPLVVDYQGLLNKKLKGNVIMANPSSSGTGYLVVKTFFNVFGEEKAWEYMDKLHKNIGVYTASGNAPTQIIARGERTIGFVPAYQGIKLQEKGELPVKIIFPKEGIGWELESSALINKKEIKPEAKIFLDWILSDNGLKIQSQTRNFVTVEKFRKSEGYPKDIETLMKKRNFKAELKNRERILKEWENRYGKK